MATIRFEPQGTTAYPMDGTLLRDVMLENRVDVYKGLARLLNCGGVGQCGTCLVEVLAGGEGLSERTPVEEQKLRRRGPTFRLACQTVVAGEVTIRSRP